MKEYCCATLNRRSKINIQVVSTIVRTFSNTLRMYTENQIRLQKKLCMSISKVC